MDARDDARQHGVSEEGIKMSVWITTVVFMENNDIYSTAYSWDDVKGLVDTC
jgi:hypothetical protein